MKAVREAAEADEMRSVAPVLAQELFKLDLFVGTGTTPNGTPAFELERSLTRLEGLALVIRLIGLEDEANAYDGPNPFKDVSSWGEKMAAYAYNAGITVGVNDEHSLFDPDRPLTYHEFTAFLLRVLGYSEGKGDFAYAKAFDKAVDAGLYQSGEVSAISKADGYLRGDAVVCVVEALLTYIKDSDETLIDKLVSGGKLSRTEADSFIEAISK
jgi:hypothetical protein